MQAAATIWPNSAAVSPPRSPPWRATTVSPTWAPSERPTDDTRSEEHTSELQSLMRISYAVFCLKKKKEHTQTIRQKLQRTTDNHTSLKHHQKSPTDSKQTLDIHNTH